MVSFDALYSKFLSSISSYTLSQLSDYEIQVELFNLAERAIAAFKFPRIDLSFEYNEIKDKHYFINDVTTKEINVLLSLMKLFWIEFQISKEEKFQNHYYDNNVRTFSEGNLLAQLNRMYENFSKAAVKAEYDYGRVGSDGRPRIGDINV